MTNITTKTRNESRTRVAEGIASKVADSLMAVLHNTQHGAAIQDYMRNRDEPGAGQAVLRDLQQEIALVAASAVYAYVETLDRFERVDAAIREDKTGAR